MSGGKRKKRCGKVCSLVPENEAPWHYVLKFCSKLLVSETDSNKNGWNSPQVRPALQKFDGLIERPASSTLKLELENGKRTADR